MSVSLLMLATTLFGVQLDWGLDNTTIGAYQESQTTLYNRLRGEVNLELVTQPAFFATLIVDHSTNYQNKPETLDSRSSIYRGFVGYAGESYRLTLGKQRVPLGVGRIWNPIDIFNPVDVEAIEMTERPGTECLRLEWAMADLSSLDVTLGRDRGEVRLKTYVQSVDVALVGLLDQDNDLAILGWEFEGELFASGIELRSEGGHFYDQQRHESWFETIVGAEYGFENSLNVLLEYKYNDENKVDYAGSIISYQVSMLWNMSLIGVINLDDESYVLGPSADYSLADDMTLSAGCFFYGGDSGSEYGSVFDRYYVRFFVHF